MSATHHPLGTPYRARYLKLKSVLHDRATGFPAVPVLLERLRTQLDDRRALGVLHIGIDNLSVVESLYGWQVLDRVLSRVATEIRESCGEELPAETLVAINAVAGDSFAGFVLERTDGREIDAAFLRRAGEALRGRLEAALGGDEFCGLGPRLTARVGQALLSRNPFYRFERRVYAALAEAGNEDGDRRQRHRPTPAPACTTGGSNPMRNGLPAARNAEPCKSNGACVHRRQPPISVPDKADRIRWPRLPVNNPHSPGGIVEVLPLRR